MKPDSRGEAERPCKRVVDDLQSHAVKPDDTALSNGMKRAVDKRSTRRHMTSVSSERDLEDERRCASSSISPGIEAELEARLARALGSLVTFEQCNYLSYVVLRYVTHGWYLPR